MHVMMEVLKIMTAAVFPQIFMIFFSLHKLEPSSSNDVMGMTYLPNLNMSPFKI